MQALIDGLSQEAEHRTDKSVESVLGTPTVEELGQRYRRTQARLLDAQEEKMWATVEFLGARAALHQALETLWPDPSTR